MARIVPFKGILYNKDKVGELADVVAPPYDVISEEKQHVLYDRHDTNVVRLILGKMYEDDSPENSRHTRAAEFFTAWQAQGILSRDDKPALYLSSVSFHVEEKTVTRYGLITQVMLETFDKGVILPHEQTFSKVKSERLGLMKICKANFSQIFSIYSDQCGILDALKHAVEGKKPAIDVVDDVGERHCLWKITDAPVITWVQEQMNDKKLFIADGHHRYETALTYRDFLKETDPSFSDDHPANAIMMYLTSMEDPGLIIFPTHRLLNHVDPQSLSQLIEKARVYFDVEEIPFADHFETSLERFRKALKANQDRTTLGVLIKNHKTFYVLSLKPGVMDEKFEGVIPATLRGLDVTVLTQLVLLDMLNLSQAALDEEKLITYSESDRHAAEAVIKGKCEVAFILNSTKISQVQDIAESGQTMPRKTTYFYPKALTGLVFNTLKP
ncbi:MAG: DUF1015 domain-containing protein [Proteobacteria bacterium]|nr:DUF1015 domain-containing protein [Pseudomonadota bacterium]